MEDERKELIKKIRDFGVISIYGQNLNTMKISDLKEFIDHLKEKNN